MDFDNINMEEAEKHLNQRLKHILGDRYEKVLQIFLFNVQRHSIVNQFLFQEANDFLEKMDDVNQMLSDLVSKDTVKV